MPIVDGWQFDIYTPGRKPNYHRVLDFFEARNWQALRRLGCRYYDPDEHTWFDFFDDFCIEKWAEGIHQEPPKKEVKAKPVQGSLFDL